MTTKNPYTKTNVNVAQGPRTGNRGSSEKRSSFKDAKDERGTLADSINRVIASRAPKDHVEPKLEGIDSDVKPKKLKRATY